MLNIEETFTNGRQSQTALMFYFKLTIKADFEAVLGKFIYKIDYIFFIF